MCRLATSLVALLCLSPAVLPEVKREGEDPAAFKKNLEALVAALEKAEKVTVYEGLPHQMSEKGLLEKELKDKKTVKHHGFPFYAGAISPKEEVAKELTALCGDEKTFRLYRGEKKCGGFHPDWLVEFGEERKRCRCWSASAAARPGSTGRRTRYGATWPMRRRS